MIKCLKPITKQSMEIIIEQMNNAFYQFENTNDQYGICFFFYIKYNDKNIPVMMTNYHIINENYLSNNKNIKLKINSKIITIEFEKTRYLNQFQDLSIIEIKNDKNKDLKFLSLDDDLYQKESEMIYDKNSIYTINYHNKNNISISFGIINDIHNSEITYISNLSNIPENSPIFNLSNNKLVGLFRRTSENIHKGIFFGFLIDKFIKEYKYIREFPHIERKKSEINILITVDSKDINKKIYFLNNNKIFIGLNFIYYNKHSIELNDLNTELYINEEKTKFINYFIPKNEGNYIIKLKF